MSKILLCLGKNKVKTYIVRYYSWLDYITDILDSKVRAKSAGAVEYTDWISAKRQNANPHECPGYDSKQSDGEALLMLELWGMWSTPALLLFPGPL